MIRIDNVKFYYSKKQSLFADLSFKQDGGSITGLLGKNGAGKSTLLNLIAGLIHPKSGNIEVNECLPFKRTPHFLSDVFLVTDEPYLPDLSIANYTKIFAPFYKNFDLDKMHQILQEFELKKTDKLHRISHGQKKKFIIAFALASNCKLLLLDEPTNGLDIPSKSIFRKVLVSSVSDDQLVLISTHQVKDIETIIDKVVVLDEGDIVFDKEISAISEIFQFQKLHNIEDRANVIYSEKCIDGYNTILQENAVQETEIDIELLFNAIINKTKITL